MPSPSKEEDVLRLFLENSPLKEWHFEEIVREAKVTRLVASKWLKKYEKECLLRRIKQRGRFPHYAVGAKNPVYYSLKRIYALQQLHKSGLLPRLLSLPNIKTIILFGSFARGDWYKDSDIDIFIFGDAPENLRVFDKKLYEGRLHRNVELHIFRNRKELREVKTGLLANIVNGYVIKGRIQDIVEVA